jgi:TolA-binding protein
MDLTSPLAAVPPGLPRKESQEDKTMKHKILTGTIAVLSLLAFMVAMTVKASSQTGSTAVSEASSAQAQQLSQLQQMEQQLAQDRAAVHSAIAEHGFNSAETQAARGKLVEDRDAYRALRQSLAPGNAARAGYGKGQGRGMGWMGQRGRRGGGACRCVRQCPYGRR